MCSRNHSSGPLWIITAFKFIVSLSPSDDMLEIKLCLKRLGKYTWGGSRLTNRWNIRWRHTWNWIVTVIYTQCTAWNCFTCMAATWCTTFVVKVNFLRYFCHQINPISVFVEYLRVYLCFAMYIYAWIRVLQCLYVCQFLLFKEMSGSTCIFWSQNKMGLKFTCLTVLTNEASIPASCSLQRKDNFFRCELKIIFD